MLIVKLSVAEVFDAVVLLVDVEVEVFVVVEAAIFIVLVWEEAVLRLFWFVASERKSRRDR